jgi:hypothetical protein
VNEVIKQADIQRAEAKRLLRGMFGIKEGESNGTIERIVDCIVGAALLESVAIAAMAQKEAARD